VKTFKYDLLKLQKGLGSSGLGSSGPVPLQYGPSRKRRKNACAKATVIMKNATRNVIKCFATDSTPFMNTAKTIEKLFRKYFTGLVRKLNEDNSNCVRSDNQLWSGSK